MRIAAEILRKSRAPCSSECANLTENNELKAKLLHRFGEALNLTMPVRNESISKDTSETRELLISADLASVDKNNKISQDSAHCEFDIAAEENLIDALTINNDETSNQQIIERYSCNKPYNAPTYY